MTTIDDILGKDYSSLSFGPDATATTIEEITGQTNLDGTLLGADTNPYSNIGRRSTRSVQNRQKTVVRDKYGNSAKDIEREKALLNKLYGQQPEVMGRDLAEGVIAISDAQAGITANNPMSTTIEISDEYASRRRAERLGKLNITEAKRTGEIGTTQYTNPNPKVDRSNPTSWIERQLDYADDKFDDAWEYMFGKPTYKNKKEEEAAARADQNLQVNEDGVIVDSRQATLNDMSLENLRNELMNTPEDYEADQLIYYGRVDNPDGTHSYKIGLAAVDPYGRTIDEDRGKDITYLWSKRTKDAAKYEALFHGNRSLLQTRRNDIGTDVEKYGPGKTEIYNMDFLGLDGTITADKIRTLNMSTEAKLAELGVNVTGRYDTRGMEAGQRALEKAIRIYGVESKEAKELSYLMGNMERKGKKERALVDVPMDLVSGVASSGQQVIGSIGDTILDAVTPGNNTLLDNWKSAEAADENWGYKGRKEVEALGRQAVNEWKKGNYVEALLKGIQASPDTVAQSLPDMALMFSGVGTAAGAGRLAAKEALRQVEKEALKAAKAKGLKGAALKEKVKDVVGDYADSTAGELALKKVSKEAAEAFGKKSTLSKLADPRQNKGLAAFAAKQTNDQIDQRLEAGDKDGVWEEIPAMFASNYLLGAIDRFAFGKELDIAPIKAMIKHIPEDGVIGLAKKAAGITKELVKKGTIEAAQEYAQTYGEVINAGLGTEKYGNNPFSDHFLDEATKGALLGFGAGGLMHAAAMTTTGVKNDLAERKRKNEYTEENMPFKETGTILDSLHPNLNEEEIIEVLGDQDIDELYTKTNEYLKGLTEEEQKEILSSEIHNVTLANFVATYKNLKKAKNPEPTETENVFKTHDVGDTLHKAVKAVKLEDTEDITNLEEELRKPNRAKEIISSIEKIRNDETVKVEDKEQLAGVLMDLATKKRDNNDDLIINKQAEAALNTLGYDIALDKGNKESADDAYNSIYNEKSTDTSKLSPQEKFRKIVEKVVKRSKDKNLKVNLQEHVDEVVGFFESLNKNVKKDKQFTDLLDFMTNEGYQSAIKEVSEAFSNLSETNKTKLLELETKVQHSLLSFGVETETRTPEQKKTIFNTRYDILIGNKDSDSGFSIQNYIDNSLKLMSPNVPITVRAAGLRNFETQLVNWIATQEKKIDEDIRLESAKAKLREELVIMQDTLDLVQSLRGNTKSKTEEKTKQSKKEKTKKEDKTKDENESKEENENKQEEKKQKKTHEEVIKDTITKFTTDTSYHQSIADAKTTEELIAVIESIRDAGKFDPKFNPYGLIKTLQTGVDFSSLNYENVDTIAPKTENEPILDKPIKVNKDAEVVSELLEGLLITPDEETNFANEENRYLAVTKLTSIFKAVVNTFMDSKISKEELKQNKELVFLLDENGNIDSAYLNLAIKSVIDTLTRNLRSLSVSYNDVDKKERLNYITEDVSDTEIAAAGIPKATLIDMIAKEMLRQIEWKKAEKTKEVNIGSIENENIELIRVDENRHNIEIATSILAAKMLNSMLSEKVVSENKIGKVKFVRLPVDYMFETSIPVTDIAETTALEFIGQELDTINEKLGFPDDKEKIGVITDPENFGPISKFVKRSKMEISKKAKKTIRKIRNMKFKIANQNNAILKTSPEGLFKMYGIDLATIPPAVLKHFRINTANISIYDGKTEKEYYATYNNYMENRYVTKDSAVSVIGRVMQVVQVVKTVELLKKKLLTKDGRMKPDARIYYDAFIGSNARIYLKTEGLATIQEDKLLRHLFVIDNPSMQKRVIKEGSLDHYLIVQDLMVGLSEVNGLTSDTYKSEDKNTPEQTYNEFKKILARFKSNRALQGILGRYKRNKLTESDEEVLIGLIGSLNNYGALNALVGLHSYNLGKLDEIELTSESDGKNSAVAFALMSNSANLPHLKLMLLSVGVITEDGLKAYSGVLDEKQKEALAEITKDGRIPSQEELNSIEPIQDAYQAAATNFIKSIPEEGRALIAELIGKELIDENGNVTKAGRDFAKDPTMTFHYGRKAKTMAKGVGDITTASFLEDMLSSEEFNIEEKLDKVKSVIELVNGLIKKEISRIESETNKSTTPDKKIVSTIKDLENQLISNPDNILDRLKQKLLYKNEDKVVNDLITDIKNTVTGLLGVHMFDSLGKTYEGLNEHESKVVKGYNIAYTIRKAYRDYIETINSEVAVYSEVQEYLEQEVGISNDNFVIGENSNDQQLNIMKYKPHEGMYAEDGSGASIAQGGNRVDYTNPDGTKETFRMPRRTTKNAITSLSPLGTHRRDTNVVHRVLQYLRVNQVFDAFVTSGRTRLAAEWLANLEFVRQTLLTPHEVTYVLRNLRTLKRHMESMPIETNDELNTLVESILEDFHIRRSIFGDKAKAKGKSIQDLYAQLDMVIKTLEIEEKRIDGQRADLLKDLGTIGQYGVMGTVEFKNGKLHGFRIRIGDISKLVTLADMGIVAKNIDLSTELAMVSISKGLVDYVNNMDINLSKDIEADTNVETENIITKVQERIQKMEETKKEVRKENRDLLKNTPRAEEYVDVNDIFAGEEHFYDEDIPEGATILDNNGNPINTDTQENQKTETKKEKLERLRKEFEESQEVLDDLFDEDGNPLTFNSIAGRIIGEEIETIANIDEDTISRIFEEYISDPSLSLEDKLLAKKVFDKYVEPLIGILHGDDLTQLNLARMDLGDNNTIGNFTKDKGTNEYTVVIGEGTKPGQSKAEVLNHEILHALFLSIFGSGAVSNKFSKEVSRLKFLYKKVRKKADPSWFGEGETNFLQYKNVFKHKNEDVNLTEFAIYMLTNATFRAKVDATIGNVRTANKVGLGIDGSKSIVYSVYNFIEDLFFKVLDMFKSESKKKVAPSKLVDEIATNLLKAEKRETSKSFRNKILDMFAYLDAYAGRITKPEKYLLPLLSKRTRSELTSKFDQAKKMVNDKVKVDSLEDTSELGAFLHSTMKTPEKVIQYVEHFVKATSVLSTNKTGYIRKVVNSILSPKGDKKIEVEINDDQKLNDLLIEYDIGSLWKIPAINFPRLVGLIKNKNNNREVTKDLLLRKLMLIFATGTNEQLSTADIEKIVNLIANAFENNKNGGKAKTEGIINATKGINDLLYRAGLKDIVFDSKNKDTYNLMLDYLDALATLEVLDRASQVDLDYMVDAVVDFEDSSVNILNHLYSILNHEDSDLNTYRALKPKGKYRDLTDETESIMVVHRNSKGVLESKLPPINERVHRIKLPNNEGYIEYYKVQTSPLNTMNQGSIGYIDNSIFSDPSMTPKSVDKLVDAINADDELAQYLLPVASKKKTDIKMVIPSFLEKKHLDIDNRASVRLGHIIGRMEEELDATKLNEDLLKMMEEDFVDNYRTNPNDFVFVSKGSKNADLRKYYNLLPAKFHETLKKEKYSLAQTGGIWVRKDTLRYNFGSVGIGMSEVLSAYGVTNEKVHLVITKVEKALADLSRFMKLEIAGKLFDVIAGNFVSNVLLEMLKFRNPVEIIKLTVEGMKYHYRLNQDINELISIKSQLDSLDPKVPDEPKTAKDRKLYKEYVDLRKEQKKIEKKIKQSPVYYLHKQGFNSALKEDITSEEALYMSNTVKTLRKKTPKALYNLGEQLYMGGKTDIGKIFNNLVSASDFGSRYATDQLDAKYFKEEVKRDFRALMKINNTTSSTRLFDEYYRNRLKIFEKERTVKLAKQHIIYGESGGKLLTALDTLGFKPFYKFKQRINQVLVERYSDKPASAIIVGVFAAYIDSLGAAGNLLERPEESFSDFFSRMDSGPIDNTAIVVSPPLLTLLGVTK